MPSHLTQLSQILLRVTAIDGKNSTAVPGVYCIKVSSPKKRQKARWKACIGLIAQGEKEIVLGKQVFKIRELQYVATPVDLPVLSRVSGAAPHEPFLALLIELELDSLRELAESTEAYQSATTSLMKHAVFVRDVSEEMLGAALRLATHLENPKAAKALGPLAVKEILYHMLQGKDGQSIYQWLRSGSKANRIQQSITQIHSDLSQEIDVEALAKEAKMSRSAFFKEFKGATALSPIQYLKRLRLIEAKRLMLEEEESAENSALRVGYRSASQFSREYSRLFGSPPLRDASRLKLSTGNIRPASR